MGWKFLAAVVIGAAISVVGIASFAREAPETGKLDSLLIAAQKICPVSGKDLHAMGGPIKAKSGEQTLYLCCKRCTGKPIARDNWAKVVNHLASAQGRCPVLNRALPDNPASTVVDGRMIFVCCRPCIAKIEADPEKHLTRVDGLLKENLKKEPQGE